MNEILHKLIESADLKLKSVVVNVTDLDPRLISFLAIAAPAHQVFFGKTLVITSGNDGGHSSVSAHYKNRAIDMRTFDKDNAENVVWAGYLSTIAPKLGVVIQDERAKFWSPHIHAWVFREREPKKV